jgi:hypothetical protein
LSALERREPQLLCDRIRRHRVRKVLLAVFISVLSRLSPASALAATHTRRAHAPLDRDATSGPGSVSGGDALLTQPHQGTPAQCT